MTSGGRTSKSGHVTNISIGLPVTSLTSTRAGPAAGGIARFGGVAAAMVTLGAQVGVALQYGAAGQRLFWRAALFFGALPCNYDLGLAKERSSGRGGLRVAGYSSPAARQYVR